MLKSRRHPLEVAGGSVAGGARIEGAGAGRALVAAALLMMSGCSAISDQVEPQETPSRISSTGPVIDAGDEAFPNLASVPNKAPTVSPPEERKQIVEGLVADRGNAAYSGEVLLPGGTDANRVAPSLPDIAPIAPDARTSGRAGELIAPTVAEPTDPPEPPGTETIESGVASPAAEPRAAEAMPPETMEIPPTPVPELMAPAKQPAPSAGVAPAEEPVAEAAEPPAATVVPGEEVPTAMEEPAPESAPMSDLAASETDVAALPPGGDGAVGDAAAGTRILFGEGSAELSATAQSELMDLAEHLSRNEDARVQLLAYASGDADASSEARRMSLSRAVAVRRFLIAHGVPSTRMDVRALGNQSEDRPADRVDIVMAGR